MYANRRLICRSILVGGTLRESKHAISAHTPPNRSAQETPVFP